MFLLYSVQYLFNKKTALKTHNMASVFMGSVVGNKMFLTLKNGP